MAERLPPTCATCSLLAAPLWKTLLGASEPTAADVRISSAGAHLRARPPLSKALPPKKNFLLGLTHEWCPGRIDETCMRSPPEQPFIAARAVELDLSLTAKWVKLWYRRPQLHPLGRKKLKESMYTNVTSCSYVAHPVAARMAKAGSL